MICELPPYYSSYFNYHTLYSILGHVHLSNKFIALARRCGSIGSITKMTEGFIILEGAIGFFLAV
jgi:hypothetical protein